MVRTKFVQVFNFLKSTDIKPMLVKMIIMVVAVVCSFFSGIGALASFLLFCIFVLMEFSFTSIVWLLLLIVFCPFIPLAFCLMAVLFAGFVFIARFTIDIFSHKTEIKDWKTISLLSICAVIILLLVLPIAPYYDFKSIVFNALFFILITITFINIEKADLKTVFIIFSIFVLSVCVIYNFLTLFDLCYEQIFIERNLLRFNICSLDPNYTGGALFCAFVPVLVLYKNKNIKKPLFYVLMFGHSVCIFNTISKATFIVYCLLIGYMLVFHIIQCVKKKDKRSLIELAVFIGVLLLSILASFKAFLEILNRFMKVTESTTDSNLSVVTTGRDNIWLVYLEEIFSSLSLALFGHGSFAPILEYDTHNAILSLLYEFGLVVFLLFFASYLIGFIKNISKANIFSWFSSICILIMYMSLSLIATISFYIFFMVFAVFVYGGKEEGIVSVDVNIS